MCANFFGSGKFLSTFRGLSVRQDLLQGLLYSNNQWIDHMQYALNTELVHDIVLHKYMYHLQYNDWFLINEAKLLFSLL